MIQKHIKFDGQDIRAVQEIQRRYGLDSFAQAVRLAVRLANVMPRADLPLPPSPKHAAKKQFKNLRGIMNARDMSYAEFQAIREQTAQQRRKDLLSKLKQES